MNQLRLLAAIAERAPLRSSPAGIALLDLLLEHSGALSLPTGSRSVQLQIKAIATAETAVALSAAALGSRFQFEGFLSSTQRAKALRFHIQHFVSIAS